MTPITCHQARDGRIFYTESTCRTHENQLDIVDRAREETAAARDGVPDELFNLILRHVEATQ